MKYFLHKWLFSLAVLHIVAGLTLPLIAYSPLFDVYGTQVSAAFWDTAVIPPPAESYQRWMVALFGPTIAAWGVLMAFLVKAGERTISRWPWNAILLSLLAWAPADMLISLQHDFWPHVYIDCLMLVLIGIPALILRSASLRGPPAPPADL